jgi:hypothetical protein
MRKYFIIILSLSSFFTKAQPADTVFILPAKGIIINKDSVLLGITTYQNLTEKLHIAVVPKAVVMPQCGTALPCIPIKRNLNFHNIKFLYYGCSDSINMQLEMIFIDTSASIKSIIGKDVLIGGFVYLLDKYFNDDKFTDAVKNKDEYHYLNNSGGVCIRTSNNLIRSIALFINL